LHSSALAIHLSAWDCAYSSCLATATCCLVCNFSGHCAWAKEISSLVLEFAKQSVERVSAAVFLSAPNELGLVIAYANGREKCCENAIAMVIAQAMGCGTAFFNKDVKLWWII